MWLKTNKIKSVEAETEIIVITGLASKIFKAVIINILHMVKNLKENMNIIMKKRRPKHKKEPHGIFRGKNTTCKMKNSLDGVNNGLKESISELGDIAIETI